MEDIQYSLTENYAGEFARLVKTVVPSPALRDVFEADLRGPGSQDIVLIKDSCIELYCLCVNYFTRISYLPFNGTIRSAVPYIRPRRATPTDIFSKIGLSTTGEPEEDERRDIILCTADSGEIVVVDWDVGRDADEETYSHAIKPGLRAVNAIRHSKPGKSTTSLGRFIKVSEDSRWMVVGAWQDMFKLTLLEDRPGHSGSNQQILYQDEMNEIFMAETRMFYVEGIIWHFEFVKPAYADGVRFIVCLLDESGQPKLLLYDRAPSSAFMISSIRLTATFPLSTEFQCPLLTVPLDTGELCIIYEKEIVLIDPQEMTVGSHYPFTFRGEMPFLEDGLITAYTKLPSSSSITRPQLFLGSSKGNVYLVDLDQKRKQGPTVPVTAMFKTNPVSQALHISRRSDSTDILIVGGEMSDTLLYLVLDDLSDLIQLHSVPNWSPIADCQLVGQLVDQSDEDVASRSVDPLALSFPSEGRHRLYVGAGHRAEGTVKELRTGYKTNVTVEFELEHVQRLWALSDPTLPPGEGNTEGYIVVSMTHNETKFLKWTSSTPREDGIFWAGDLDIDDWTANLSTSLMISETTLTTCLTVNGILQVTPTGVYLHGGVRRQVSAQERIVQAVVVGSHIVLVIYNETGYWNLMFVKIVSHDSGTYLSEGYSIQLPREPSAMNLFVDHELENGQILSLCVLAFRFPRKLVFWRVRDDTTPEIVREFSIDEETSHVIPDGPRHSDIHAIDLIRHGGVSHLLMGLRQGSMMSYRMIITEKKLAFFDAQNIQFGNSQVDFITATHHNRGKESVFVTCGYLWEARVENGLLKIDEVLFDDFRIPNVLSGSVSRRHREIILLMGGFIRFIDVGSNVGVWPRTIHIGQTPRRLHYDAKIQRMLVACTNVESESGKSSSLAIVDLLRNESHTISLMENDEDISNIFSPNYTINCLYEWRFQSYDKVFSLICLGMGDSITTGRIQPGRLVIISCRLSNSNKRNYRTKFIRKFQTKHPVYAITKIDEYRLVYSWGTTLSLITMEPRVEDEGHRPRLENKDLAFQARSPIIHITVKGNLLYCSTLKDSLSVIEFNPEDNSLKACISDPKPRFSTFHFVFQDHIIITDKLCNMIGLAGDVASRHKSFNEVFRTQTNSLVARIHEGIISGPRTGNAVKRPSILAVSIDGSITALKRTRNIAVLTLTWIHRYLNRDGIQSRLFMPDPVISKKDNMAINVDFLLLLTERMIPGIKTPLTELPEILQECLRHMCDDSQTLDLLTIARNMLHNEMGGITL